MDRVEFKQMCQSHALSVLSDTAAAGVERGYVISLRWTGKNTVSLSVPVSREDQKLHARELRQKLRENFGRGVRASWAGQAGYLTFTLNTATVPDVYCQGVVAVLNILRELGVTVPDRCCVCGGYGCDAAVPRGPAYTPAHRACLEKSVTGAKTKADKNARGGSYLLGALGAFLGSLVGAVPSALSMILAERIYVVLFMLIPICAYFGYKLFRGKMDRFAIIATVVFTALGVYFLNFGVTLYYVADSLGLPFSVTLGLVPSMLGDPKMWLEVSKSEMFIESAIFALLGVVLAWGIISRTAKTDVRDASALLERAIPYGSSMQSGFDYDPEDYVRGGEDE